ncbi:MAG: carboxypeptidase-like regulatory domain-containing protein [Acidobacteriota bacterium]
MRLPAPLAIALALLVCCAFCPPANSQTSQTKKAPEATVSGKVSIKGKPAPEVVVGLRSSQPAEADQTFKATTDQDGIYRISNVPGGSYVIAPVAPAFVISDVNNSMGRTVVITEGEKVEGIDFELVRGGVITGRVTDADGRPIIEDRINLLPADPSSQRGAGNPVSLSFQTDDRGIYRMFGLRPGRYKISIGNADLYRGSGRARSQYSTTFYPNTTDPAKAGVVEIDEGSEATKIDITVSQTVPIFSVSGRVVDGETGKPVPSLAIGLSRIVTIDANNSSSHGGSTGVRSDTQGDFRLEKLPAGKYSISIEPLPASDLRAEPVTFDVVDEDVTGLVIKSSTGASLSGTVIFEGTRSKNATAALERAYISALISKDDLNSSWSRAEWMPRDGSFRLGGLPAGIAKFSVGTMSNAKGLMISRVERDGIAQPNGIQIQTAEHVTGISVVLVYINGSIRGRVRLENGTLPSSGRLFIQLTKPDDPSVRVQPWVVDSRGHFLIEGLAAGSYELTVTAYAPEWRQRPPTAKQTVTVADGVATEVTVTLDLSLISYP